MDHYYGECDGPPEEGVTVLNTEPIDITVPLSDIVFGGEVKTQGTNGPGDLLYVQGWVGPLYIDTSIDRNFINDEDGLPDTVKVRVHISPL